MAARTTLSDPNIKKPGIADAIYMVDWIHAPLLNLFGFGSENLKKLKPVFWPATELKWFEDSMRPFKSTLSAGINDSTLTIPVATGTGVYFRRGDIIGIGSEKLLVTAVAADNLTVAARGYGTTNAASHLSADVVTILTRAMPENAPHQTGYTTVTTPVSNYTQILSEAVEASRTAIKARNWGYDDELDYQVGKLFKDGGQVGRLPQLLERTWFHGEPVQRGSGNAFGSMGGFRSFVAPERIYPGGGKALDRAMIHKPIREVRQAGGYVDTMLVGAWHQEKIADMYEHQITRTVDDTRGGSKITKIVTPSGEVEVVFHHDMPPGEIHFVCKDKVGWLPFDDFAAGEVENMADGKMANVVGEYTLFVINGHSHAILEDVSETK